MFDWWIIQFRLFVYSSVSDNGQLTAVNMSQWVKLKNSWIEVVKKLSIW
jgi:hypothetical protein